MYIRIIGGEERGQTRNVLSLLIFNIYINDMLPLFQEENIMPPKLKESTIGRLLFEDDLFIISKTAEDLQNSMNKLEAYCSKWKLHLNTSKSKTMCLNKTGKIQTVALLLGNKNWNPLNRIRI